MTEEQIKQKAEEYAYNEMENWNYKFSDEIEYKVKQIWLDGYHECQKEREWHYVKDGDLPKENQKCYFIYSNTYGEDNKVIFSKSVINVLTGIYAFFIDEETGEETTDPCFYDDINDEEIGLKEVYAWKEIVLPKEIE